MASPAVRMPPDLDRPDAARPPSPSTGGPPSADFGGAKAGSTVQTAILRPSSTGGSTSPGAATWATRRRTSGKIFAIGDDNRRGLKASLLRLVPLEFTAPSGIDAELRLRAEKVLSRYGNAVTDEPLEGEFSAAGEGARRRLALHILGAFGRRDQGEFTDTGLRVSALIALQKDGKPGDLGAIVPHLRKGNTDDRVWALRALEKLARDDYPVQRGTLSQDPVIAPLLQPDRHLGVAERTQVIEAVLVRGRVIGVERSHQSKNFNETYFVTFEEMLDGEHIRGVYKPEPPPGSNHEETQSAREVLAYELDARFLKTGLVPPTREVVFSVDGGQTFRLGSMQYFLSGAEDLGTAHLDDDAQWKEHANSENFQRELDRSTLLRYLYDDVDHNREPNGFGDRNTMLLRDDDGVLHRKMIDFGNSFGLRPPWSRKIINAVPKNLDDEMTSNLRSAPMDEVATLASTWIQPQFVIELVARWNEVRAGSK